MYCTHCITKARAYVVSAYKRTDVVKMELAISNADLVVEACAMMWPPMGFLGSVANMEAPSTWATTWLVITTATPNCGRGGIT